ncbi:hypothetical protein ABB37_06638 [Leptomonas pyrrhocoris]|uniref:Uncharacterized protein n=1 Tax=Leptomonas pyrrhocoris TaxID=157538 RepID=A0A0N0VEB2_LEPPY|nr:hypothetical protein ABB37_06638 [Leptomonas pyrrhocoris]KPA77821.1 hypothetical protein ABB37_06638 [Leptomonas pyrrhocoris]|eukprot:XP_015656260.1 hypothetical protein ABB37_06638 [Leptomonas pyrrhocoris]
MPPKQPPAKKKTAQRVRVTNKALESRQFSTVRLPRTNEVAAQKVDVQSMFRELATDPSRLTSGNSGAAVAAPSSSFDPIVNDAMFSVVAHSQYWPPPSLEALHAKTGQDHGDGFDSYDRREDDKRARKERAKVIKGEINHPRGKTRQNTIVKLSDSSGSDEGESEEE